EEGGSGLRPGAPLAPGPAPPAPRSGKTENPARGGWPFPPPSPARRSRKFGWAALACRSPDQLGLITLSGIVVAPYPFKDWRVKPNAPRGRRRGARGGGTARTGPCGGGGGKGDPPPVGEERGPPGKPGGKRGCGPSAAHPPPH